MFCKNCGNELKEGTKFCDGCGAPQEVEASQPTAAQQPQVATNTPASAPKKNNNLKLIIVAIVVVVCFAIGSFVIAPSLSKDNDDGGQVGNLSQSQNDNETDNNIANQNSDNSTEKNLTAFDGSTNVGKAFLSDLGEYGKISLSVGYNPENDVIRQVSASITVTTRHSEYSSMKSDFENWERRISNSNDKNIEASFVELSDSVSFVIGIKNLNEADRAERVAWAEEVLDFVADKEDYAFYIDDITNLLVNTYGFTVVD